MYTKRTSNGSEVILVGWFCKCLSINEVGSRHFVEGLYQALFSFSLAHWNVIYKAKQKYNWMLLHSHLVQTVSFLVFVIFWLKQCTNVLIPSYTNVAQHTRSYILTAHLAKPILIDFWMLFEFSTSIRQGSLSGSLVRVYKSRNLVGLEFHNLRSGPILAVLIYSPWRLPLKLGLIETLTSLYSLRPDFGRNADWLLEQCHRIWLAVGFNGSWKSLFLAWLFSRVIIHRRREGSILLSFLLFYGLIVGKYALYVPRKFSKFRWLFISSQDLLYSWN